MVMEFHKGCRYNYGNPYEPKTRTFEYNLKSNSEKMKSSFLIIHVHFINISSFVFFCCFSEMVRTATPFPMVSLLFVFTAFVISNIGHIRPQRTILAFVSGIFFILSGNAYTRNADRASTSQSKHLWQIFCELVGKTNMALEI